MGEAYFIKGVLMGIVFGVPAGAIGVLTVRNSLEYGFIAGLATGLGSSAADLLYGVICVYGMTLIANLLFRWQTPLGILGSVVIFILGGMQLSKGKSEPAAAAALPGGTLGRFFPSFVIAIMNPATILSFLAAFTAFGISGNLSPVQGLQLMAGIFLGTVFWWAALSGTVSFFRGRISGKIYLILDRLLGSLLVVFGLFMLMRSLSPALKESGL